MIGADVLERFFHRLTTPIVNGLTVEQRSAIADALAAESNKAPPVNIRIGVPLPFGRWYVSIFAGSERRSPARLKRDRQVYPLTTFGNFLFIAAGIAIFYVLSAIAFLLYFSVLEF
jgi:hypothetical protein